MDDDDGGYILVVIFDEWDILVNCQPIFYTAFLCLFCFFVYFYVLSKVK